MNIMQIYDRLPIFLQNAAVSFEGYRIQKSRYNVTFERVFQEFMNRNDWSYEQKCEYRDLQLQKMVKHCYETVPYYKKTFDKYGIDYRDIKYLDDLQRLPIITKQTVKENYIDFFSTAFDKKELISQHTSGTSGSGFTFYQNKEANAAVWAHVWRGNYNIGLERGTWCGYFGGRSIVPKSQNKPPYYRINKPGKQIMFSAFHMRPDVLQEYFEVLNYYQPQWIQAFPSSLLPLVSYMEEKSLKLNYIPKVITLSSENVAQFNVEKIYRILGAYPMQNYAQSEAVATFRQTLDRRMFVVEDFSAVELVPEGKDNLCRIIGTTLSNYAMPFLRYDMKDLVTYRQVKEGREILSLDGREEDDIKLKNGGTLRRLDFIFKDQGNIVEAQIVQKSLELLEFHIVKGSNYTKADENKLNEDIQEYLAGNIAYRIIYVEKIEKTKSGKMKFIVSEI